MNYERRDVPPKAAEWKAPSGEEPKEKVLPPDESDRFLPTDELPPLDTLSDEELKRVMEDAFREAGREKGVAQREVRRLDEEMKQIWLRMRAEGRENPSLEEWQRLAEIQNERNDWKAKEMTAELKGTVFGTNERAMRILHERLEREGEERAR